MIITLKAIGPSFMSAASELLSGGVFETRSKHHGTISLAI
jgi:hypothetical protein